MEEGNMQIIEYLGTYFSREKILEETLYEIARRLEQKVYPNGEKVWEQVFWEKRQDWNLDEETFEIVLELGRGFFGRKRSENISFLQRGLMSLEERQKEKRKKDAKERKVWIPVSMLGGIMLLIILV
jgi:stage III sporulation protein AB